jgi:hypothetical protein
MQRSEDVGVAQSRAQTLNCRVVPPFGDLDSCLPKERVSIRSSPWRSPLDGLGCYGACSIDASGADERHNELGIVRKGTRRWVRPEFRRLFQVCDSIRIPSHSQLDSASVVMCDRCEVFETTSRCLNGYPAALARYCLEGSRRPRLRNGQISFEP